MGLVGSVFAAGLLLAAPAAFADTAPPVSVTVAASLPGAFCGASFCFAALTASWTVSPLRLPTVSATMVPTIP
jgi:hypothetical protein